MLKFFRRIRQKLLSENKLSKYLIYAVGEIVLVVIGILIALQINNWNEARKTKNIEIKLLSELKEDLIETRADLLTDIEKSDYLLSYTDSLYRLVLNKNNEPLEISVTYIYETPTLFPKLSAYKSIQAYGVNIISNDSLRKSITNFYELHLERVNYGEVIVKELNENDIKNHLLEVSTPVSNFEENESLFIMYETLLETHQNSYFVQNPQDKLVHLLKEKFNLIYGLNNRYSETKERIDTIIEIIDTEVSK